MDTETNEVVQVYPARVKLSAFKLRLNPMVSPQLTDLYGKNAETWSKEIKRS